jgi:ParB-like chromosome segregation protein Spo0J
MHLTETDKVNNLTKLARHRIASRALALDPDLIVHAREALDRVERDWGYVPALDEWRELLKRPIEEIRRAMTARTENMDRLRIDSPFYLLSRQGLDFTDEDERRRIWWIAKRVAGVSTRDEYWTRTADYEAQRQTWWGHLRPARVVERETGHAEALDHEQEGDTPSSSFGM